MSFRSFIPTLVLAAAIAPAAVAEPPVGSWAGGTISMLLDPGGDYLFQEPGVNLVGRWDWTETGQQGGVLTLRYVTPTATQTFQNALYFGIIWMGQDSIVLTDPVSGRQFPLERRF